MTHSSTAASSVVPPGLVGRKNADPCLAEGASAYSSGGTSVTKTTSTGSSTAVSNVVPVSLVLRKRADPPVAEGSPTDSPGTTGQDGSLAITRHIARSDEDYLAVLMKKGPCSPIIKPSHLVYATTPDGRYFVERTPDGNFVPRAVGQIHGTMLQQITRTPTIQKTKESPTEITFPAALAFVGRSPDNGENAPSGVNAKSGPEGDTSEKCPGDCSVRKSPMNFRAKKLQFSSPGEMTENRSVVRKDPPEEKSNERALKKRRVTGPAQETNQAASPGNDDYCEIVAEIMDDPMNKSPNITFKLAGKI